MQNVFVERKRIFHDIYMPLEESSNPSSLKTKDSLIIIVNTTAVDDLGPVSITHVTS